MTLSLLINGGLLLPLALVLAWWRSKGQRARFLCALVCLFFAPAGLFIVCRFGEQAVRFAAQGGPMWWAALAMGCTAAVGAIFTAVFGYFCLKLFNRVLWRAGIYAAIGLTAIGMLLNGAFEQDWPLILPADGSCDVQELVDDHGTIHPLGFSLRVERAADNTAYCRIESPYKGHTETRREALRLGDTLSCKGCDISLRALRPGEPILAEMRAHRAPGDLPFYAGLIGSLLCLGGSLLCRRES